MKARLTIALLTLTPAAIGLVLFTSSGRDDAHITYWAAHTLSTQGQVLNYNGERLEQSSSLLHVLLLAGISKLMPLSIATTARILSVFGALAIVWMTYRLAEQSAKGRGLQAAMLVATASPIAYWSMSGMETTVAAALALATVTVIVRLLSGETGPMFKLWAIVVGGAFLIARPESPPVLACAAAMMFVVMLYREKHSPQPNASGIRSCSIRVLIVGSVVVAISVLVMGVRWWYFGAAFPHPVLAKSDGLSIASGMDYLVRHAFEGAGSLLWCLAFGGIALTLVMLVRRQAAALADAVSVSFLCAYLAFLITSGGDWMEGGRFLVTAIPFAALSAVALVHRITRPEYQRSVVVAVAILQCLSAVQLARTRSTGMPLWAAISHRHDANEFQSFSWLERTNRVNRRDMPLVGPLRNWVQTIHGQTGQPVTIMSHNMGMIAYYVSLTDRGRTRFIDTHALSTPDFLQCDVTAARPRSQWGLAIGYDDYFRMLPKIESDCSCDKPDIIFDRFSHPQDLQRFEENGYKTVYIQRGRVKSGSPLLRGAPIHGDQLIAIRSDLLADTPNVQVQEYAFH